jgi:cob(I)alamin adenosyltransferase
VIVNTGDGKGKTTAAMGILVRSVARGWKVCVIQFIKSDDWKVGEEKVGKELGVEWWSLGDGFTWDSDDMDRSEALAREAWAAGKQKIASGDYDLVLLDEMTYPMNWGWIAIDDVVAAINSRPAHVNVIVTGRDAPKELIEVADTVTEMRNVKHAYEQGIAARKGIDF